SPTQRLLALVRLVMILLLTLIYVFYFFFFFSSRRRHTRLQGDWSSDVCSSDLRCEANEWRSMCGCTRSPSPLARAQAARRVPTTAGEMRLPRAPMKRAFSVGRASWLRASIQACRASRALAPTGTVRVLAPLPVT